MAKRFHDTEIWKEDWFLSLPLNYREFWFYILDSCDHAGIWKPNFLVANSLYGFKVDLKKALKLYNLGKERVLILKNGRWFIRQFIPFQYGNLSFSCSAHIGVLKALEINGIGLNLCNPSVRVKEGLGKGSTTLKDKDKDKEVVKDKDKDKENGSVPSSHPILA